MLACVVELVINIQNERLSENSVVTVGLAKRSIRLLPYSLLCTSSPTLVIIWSLWTPVVFPF